MKKKVFHKRYSAVKDFYARVPGLLTICNCLRVFKKLLKSVFILALRESNGKDKSSQDLASQKSQKLFRQTETFTINEDDLIDRDCFEDTDNFENNKISGFIDSILDSAK